MNYYEEDDNRPVLYGGVAAVAYVIVVAALLLLTYFPITEKVTPQMMVIEIVEEEKPAPKPVVTAQAPRHENLSVNQNTQQVTGTDEVTQTVNQRAIFRSNKGGVDEPEDVGNPYAKQAEENTTHGNGGGLNSAGNDQLDEGLRGRGLVGTLPVPSYPGNVSGKIVIRVTVDQHGKVTNATYEAKGSTSSDAGLIAAAIAAAKRAQFTESRSYMQGGTITYNFKLN